MIFWDQIANPKENETQNKARISSFVDSPTSNDNEA